jgi:hypothetical protein
MSRPGELTVRFLRGQQIRFLNPIRLYFSVSLLFFLVFHFTQPASKIVVLRGDLWPAIEQDTSPSSEGRAAEAFGQQFLAKMISKYGSVQTFGSHLASEFFERLQWMIFVCVPIYAVLLKVIYIRTSRTYLAHLVFAFHLHSAFFVGALIQALLAALLRTPHPGLTRWIFVLFSLWLVTYLFLAQRKVHGQRWVTIATKFFALYIAYAFILIGAVAATGLLAFYLTASV